MNDSVKADEDTFEDVEECLREVAKKHGRMRFAAMMLAGMGGQAAAVLMGLAEKHRSRHGVNAVVQLSGAVEQLVNALGEAHGWTAEELGQVDKDIREAWEKRETGRIALVH